MIEHFANFRSSSQPSNESNEALVTRPMAWFSVRTFSIESKPIHSPSERGRKIL